MRRRGNAGWRVTARWTAAATARQAVVITGPPPHQAHLRRAVETAAGSVCRHACLATQCAQVGKGAEAADRHARHQAQVDALGAGGPAVAAGPAGVAAADLGAHQSVDQAAGVGMRAFVGATAVEAGRATLLPAGFAQPAMPWRATRCARWGAATVAGSAMPAASAWPEGRWIGTDCRSGGHAGCHAAGCTATTPALRHAARCSSTSMARC